MAKYRKIDTRIWHDEKFKTLSQDSKFMFFYLLTSIHSSPWGAYVIDDLYIQADIGFTPQKIKLCWKEIVSNKLANRCEKTNLVCFRNWFKYNPPVNQKTAIACLRGILDLPKSDVLSTFCKDSEWVSYQLANSNLTFPEPVDDEQEQEQDKDLPKKNGHCPSQKIIEAYHRILPELPEVKDETQIKQKIAARWKADKSRQSLEWWDAFFINEIKQSDFLMGKKTDFHATLDWISGPQNFSKILNGLYKNKQKKEPELVKVYDHTLRT